MINIGIAISIAAFTGLEYSTQWLPDSPPITMLIVFLHGLEFMLVYSSLYSQIDRCNIIHDRTIKGGNRYKSFHQISHSKETLISVSIYFILTKAILFTQQAYLRAIFLPAAILFPLFYAFPLNKRYSFLVSNSKNELVHVQSKFILIYAVYVVAITLLLDFNLPWVFVMLTPFLKILLGNICSFLIWLTSAYCIAFNQPFTQNIMPLVSLLLMTRQIAGMAVLNGKTAIKIYKRLLLINILPAIWLLCYANSNYGHLYLSLRAFALANIFHNYLLLLGLKLAKIGSKNRPMSFSEVYFIQSFCEYMTKNSENTFGDGRFEKLEDWIGMTITILINVAFPLSFWTFAITAHILIWANKVVWNQYILVLRIGILLFRDLIKINYSFIQNSILRFLAITLSCFGKSGFTEDTSNINLRLAGIPHFQLDPFSESVKYHALDHRHYNWLEIISLVFIMLITAALLLIPKKARLMEDILLIGYPITLITIYQMAWNFDELQLHIYGYLTADVAMLFFK